MITGYYIAERKQRELYNNQECIVVNLHGGSVGPYQRFDDAAKVMEDESFPGDPVIVQIRNS